MSKRFSRALALAGLLLLAAPAFAASDCDRSESIRTPSPDGQWIASVQEEVCAGANGAAAGITVVIHAAKDEARAQRLFITAVPRSRDDWPRVRWAGSTQLDIRVPNLLEIAEPPKPQFENVHVVLQYCGDNPDDRAKLAQYKLDVKQWQRDVTAWAARRKEDAAAAGPRPPRPQEPRLPFGRCID